MQLFDWLKSIFVPPSAPLGFAVRAVSVCGPVRKENQDSITTLPDHGLFAVADGMGGGACGGLASAWLKEALMAAAKDLAAPKFVPKGRAAALDAVLQAVNRRIRDYCAEQGYKSMGCTVALMLFDPADRRRAVVMHAGDSRVYRLRGGELECLTRDHTVGMELSSKTASRREAAELSSRKNPLTHILTRAVGTEFRVRPEWQEIGVRRGDRYLLCTDGVHDMLDDVEIAALMKRRGRPSEWVGALEEQVLKAGAGDNYSMIGLALTCDSNGRG